MLKLFDFGAIKQKTLDYERRFPEAMAALELAGVHPACSKPMPNPYLDGEIDNEPFSNVGEHCVAVAFFCEQVCTAMMVFEQEFQQQGISNAPLHISQELIDLIIERALLHDANKRLEVFRKKARKAGRPLEVYSVEAYTHLQEDLKRMGQDKPHLLEYLAHAGEEAGHDSLASLVRMDKHGKVFLYTGEDEETRRTAFVRLMVHLADDMTFSNHKPPHETYFAPMPIRGMLANFSSRYPFLFTKGFGFGPDREQWYAPALFVDRGEASALKHPRTYAEWQIWVARETACYFVNSFLRYPPENCSEPEWELCQIVNTAF